MSLEIIAILCLVAFIAGFADSIFGGGGLIQTPLTLSILPQYNVSSIIGSLKIPAFSGTGIAVIQYLKKTKVRWKLFLIMAVTAFSAARYRNILHNCFRNHFKNGFFNSKH